MAKPQYASLTAGLLARKGEAHPAAVDLANHGVKRDPSEDAKTDSAEQDTQDDQKSKLSTVAARRLPQLMDPIWEKRHQEQQSKPAVEEPFPDSVHELEDAEVRKRVEMIREELNRASMSRKAALSQEEAKPKSKPAKKPKASAKAKALPVCDGLKKTKTQAQKRSKKIARAAVTMRLDPSRYLAMKLVGAKLSRTNQSILLDALDMYMKSLTENELSDCNCLKKIIKESFEHA